MGEARPGAAVVSCPPGLRVGPAGGRRSVPWAWPRGCQPEPPFRLSALTAGSQQLPLWPGQGLNGLLVA